MFRPSKEPPRINLSKLIFKDAPSAFLITIILVIIACSTVFSIKLSIVMDSIIIICAIIIGVILDYKRGEIKDEDDT